MLATKYTAALSLPILLLAVDGSWKAGKGDGGGSGGLGWRDYGVNRQAVVSAKFLGDGESDISARCFGWIGASAAGIVYDGSERSAA